MRRSSVVLLLIAFLLLAAGAVGCGSATPATGGSATPEEVLAAAITASDTLKSATGSFDVAVSLDMDTSQLPEEQKALYDKPIQVSGTLAFGSEPLAADLTVSLSMAGQTTDFGVKALDSKAWLGFLDKWYETPAELQGMLSKNSEAEAQMAKIEQLVSDLGVDPVTWMKELRLVGEETINDSAVYHLAGTPDVAKIVADAVGLMQSKELMSLIDPSGEMSLMMGSQSMMPNADELEQVQTQIAEMFKDFKIDLWIDKADSMLRKAVIAAHITPPKGEEADGLNAVDVNATINLDNINKSVTVEAPASPLPFTDLEKAFQENPGMFGMFSGMSGGMQTY